MAGIGCHSMALFMPDRHTATLTHMGGEGVNWIGQAPFTAERHVFQNLGDGTYAHSGLMAIRAAAAAGVNITYKILYNDAVAMTGGQPVEGAMTVPQIAQQVLAEGARRVVVVADEPGKYPKHAGFPAGVAIRHRDDLDAVQRELRDIEGLTVLIYDQTCAAEKRRRRKRGKFPDPPERVFINDAVCEGCGDCSDKSNCIAVLPVETALGRKRRIDQSNCNKDFSCLKGFCPSFVTVRGATPRKLGGLAANDSLFANLPEPKTAPLERPYGILVTGVGGTGVVTLGALIGMAAHLEGKGCTVLDISGLAQKNGAVMSHVRLAPQPEDLYAVRVASGGADVLLACDPVVAASPVALSRLRAGATKAIINSHAQPTAAFIFKPDIDFETAKMLQAIKTAAGDSDSIDATALAAALMGDSIAANLFMLGYAFQKGLVPLTLAAIARAIELNGVAVDANKRSFSFGRLAAHDRAQVEALVRGALRDDAAPEPQGLDALVEHRAAFLKSYQNCRLRAALSRRGADDSHRRSKARPRLFRPGRSDSAQPVHPDGLQGRIRSGAALYRRRFFEKTTAPVRWRFHFCLSSGAAALGTARSDDRRAEETRLRPLDASRLQAFDVAAPVARHGARYFRLHPGTPHGTALDRRIRSDPSRAFDDAQSGQSCARDRDRIAAGEDARLRPHQGAQRRKRQGLRGRAAGAAARQR